MELKNKEMPLWNAAEAVMLGSMLHTAPPNPLRPSAERVGWELSPIFYPILSDLHE